MAKANEASSLFSSQLHLQLDMATFKACLHAQAMTATLDAACSIMLYPYLFQ